MLEWTGTNTSCDTHSSAKKPNYERHGKLHDCIPQKGTESIIPEHHTIGTSLQRLMRIWMQTRCKQCFLAKNCIVSSHRCRWRNWLQAAHMLLSSTKNEAVIITNRSKLNTISAQRRRYKWAPHCPTIACSVDAGDQSRNSLLCRCLCRSTRTLCSWSIDLFDFLGGFWEDLYHY